ALQQELEQWADGAELRFEYADAAVRAEKNTPVVRAFLKGIRDAGGTPRFKMKTGTSDMNILAPVWGCPTLAYGPGDSKLDHTPHEAIELDDFERGVEVLTAALSQLAGSSLDEDRCRGLRRRPCRWRAAPPAALAPANPRDPGPVRGTAA